MKYNDIKHLIKSGDLCVYSGNSFFDGVIKFFTQSKYDHVAIAIIEGEKINIIESVLVDGTHIVPLENNLPFYWVSTGVNWTPSVETFAKSNVGQPYSFIDAFRVVTGEGPMHDDEVCSVLAGAIYRSAGVPLDPHLDYSPAALVKYFTDKGHSINYVD